MILKSWKAIDVFVKGVILAFLLLFSGCILFKSRLLLTPVTLISLALIFCVIFISKYFTEHYRLWLMFVFVIAFLTRLLFIKIWPITPLSDCEMGYRLSELLSSTPISNWHEVFAANGYYYDVWPMHVPFILYQTLCISLFGQSIFSIQIVNMFFSAATCVLVAVCAEGLSGNKRAGIIAGFFMAVHPTTLFMACFLVNQHVSTCFFVASMCFILKQPFKRDILNWLLAGIVLAVGQLMRPEMTIVFLAVLCMLLYGLFKTIGYKTEKTAKAIGRFFLRGIAFALAFLLMIYAANACLLGLRWIDHPITDSKLEYKMMIGLHQETEGRFQDSDYPLAANDIAVREVLQERLSPLPETVTLMMKKLCFQFSSYNYWWLQADQGGAVRQFVTAHVFEPITQSYMFFMMVLAIVAILQMRKRTDPQLSLLYIIYIGFMCAFALMEVQQRYAYITIPVVMILSSLAPVNRFEDTPVRKTHMKRGLNS